MNRIGWEAETRCWKIANRKAQPIRAILEYCHDRYYLSRCLDSVPQGEARSVTFRKATLQLSGQGKILRRKDLDEQPDLSLPDGVGVALLQPASNELTQVQIRLNVGGVSRDFRNDS